jgi:hypothetical protein
MGARISSDCTGPSEQDQLLALRMANADVTLLPDAQTQLLVSGLEVRIDMTEHSPARLPS